MTKKLKYTELRSLDSAVEQLQELVDGLRMGVLRLEHGEQQLLLTPGAVLDFAVYGERKGAQERFELALEWRRQELTINGGLPGGSTASKLASAPAPAAALGWAVQAETERLEDEPESHAPVVQSQDEIDDEAVTVRQSSPPGGQLSASQQALDSDAQRFERLYREARTPVSDDRLRLDEQRFADSLAAAGLEPQLQKELRTLARQADEEGRERLFEERSISELIASTLSGVA